MNKKCRFICLIALIIVTVFAATCVSYADTVPQYTDYKACSVYYKSNVSDASWTQKFPNVTMIRGNLYITVDLLKSLGISDAFEFVTSDDCCYINMAKLNNYFGDEDTTEFIRNNAGNIEIPLKYFGTNYANTTHWISFEVVASLARLSYTYIDDSANSTGSLYIIPYSGYTGKTVVAKGTEIALLSLSEGGTQTSFKENELLYIDQNESINTNEGTYYLVKNCAGQAFYVNRSDVNVVTNTDSVPCYSRSTKEKTVFSNAINGTWTTDFESTRWATPITVPDKIEGLDLFASVTLIPDSAADGTCDNHTDYGTIQSAHDKGYQWWLCAMNEFESSYANVYTKLMERSVSNKLIAQYLVYCCLYNADGINIDFEALYEACNYLYGATTESVNNLRNYFISFMQNLSAHANKLGLTTSVCTYAATSWNNKTVWPYDILGQCCDFVCEMTYSEDTSGSSISSKGAIKIMSKSWWTERTNYLASLMPKEKILMGVAYYSEAYYMDGSTERKFYPKLNYDFESQGYGYITSSEWDEEVGQTIHYNKYTTTPYYIEDARSSALKAQYILDNNMGGTMGWMFNYMSLSYPQTLEIYKAFDDVYSKETTYQDYVPEEE